MEHLHWTEITAHCLNIHLLSFEFFSVCVRKYSCIFCYIFQTAVYIVYDLLLMTSTRHIWTWINIRLKTCYSMKPPKVSTLIWEYDTRVGRIFGCPFTIPRHLLRDSRLAKFCPLSLYARENYGWNANTTKWMRSNECDERFTRKCIIHSLVYSTWYKDHQIKFSATLVPSFQLPFHYSFTPPQFFYSLTTLHLSIVYFVNYHTRIRQPWTVNLAVQAKSATMITLLILRPSEWTKMLPRHLNRQALPPTRKAKEKRASQSSVNKVCASFYALSWGW